MSEKLAAKIERYGLQVFGPNSITKDQEIAIIAALKARPEALAQLGLFIIVLFKKKEDRRVVLSVYAPDLEAAKHMAIGRYMGEWIVERAIAKADPTVFRVHDDAWYENESEPPMNSCPINQEKE